MNHYRDMFRLIVIFALSLMASSCMDVLKTKTTNQVEEINLIYPNDDPARDPELELFNNKEIVIGAPRGWYQGKLSDESIVFNLSNHKGKNLLVFCYAVSFSEDKVVGVLRNAVGKVVPDATKTDGMWEINGEEINPRFEQYKGSQLTGRGSVDLDIYIGWRMGLPGDKCIYGLLYTAANSKEENSQEFFAILRSLK